MAKKLIIAYVMHEHEIAAVADLLDERTRTDGFLMGEIYEADIERLQAKNIVIQRIEESVPDELQARRDGIALVAKAGELSLPAAEARPVGDHEYCVIEIRGPLLPEWRVALVDHGGEVIEAVGPFRVKIRVERSKKLDLAGLPFVASIRNLLETEDYVGSLEGLASAPDTGVEALKTFELRLQRADDQETVVTWLEDRGVKIAGAKGRKIRIHVLESDQALRDLSQLPEVGFVEEYIPPKLHNDRARLLLGIDQNNAGQLSQVVNEDGAGQIVAVADTGLDDTHPDFQGRVAGLIPKGRAGDATDPHGHGTHVAGSVLGDGSASGGDIKGVAPGAQLFFQSILDSNGGLGGLPWDLNDLFDEAYQAGARIHNNSWGAAVRSEYTFNSIEADEFVEQHQDMLIVISAGNEGTSANPRHTQSGHVDWLSIGAPASSKNSLTVGASRSDRNSGGYAALTYGQVWPGDFPNQPIANELVSGDSEGMAAFSSRGPCTDRRVKPDVVAPGTDIASSKSKRAPLSNFWGAYPGHSGKYAYMGGTSMAAPLVAGCAAIVREYLTTQRNHDASAALLKAIIINGAKWLTGNDSVAEFSDFPNYHQGFGCVDMPSTIPNSTRPKLSLEFVDSWQNNSLQFNRVGERFRFTVRCQGGEPLRVALSWTDTPGRALQNNLNLIVEEASTGRKYVGNENLPLSLTVPDTENNTEVVRIEAPTAGDYNIMVVASNLLSISPLAFAMVVSGELSTPLVQT